MEISVIIPTYHRTHTIAIALDSVLRQTLKPAEILVVLDGCEDAECMACAVTQRLCGDRGVRAVQLKHGHRWDTGAACRNKGIELTTAPYLAYLDDDNRWQHNHLESLVRALELNKYASFAISGIAFTYHERTIWNARCLKPRHMEVDSSSFLHERRLVEEYGPWGATGCVDQDWELVSRWVRGGEVWAATGQPTLCYTVRHPVSWAVNYAKNRAMQACGLEVHRLR